MSDDYGSRVRAARNEVGISQAKLAALIGYYDATMISRIETGNSRPSVALRCILDCFIANPSGTCSILSSRERDILSQDESTS